MPTFVLRCSFLLALLSLSTAYNSHLHHKRHSYLDVTVKVVSLHSICLTNDTCVLRYSLSLYRPGDEFGLQSAKPQNNVLQFSDGSFNDSTVIRLTKGTVHYHGTTYLGVRLLADSELSQDLAMVDVTKVIGGGERRKVDLLTDSFRILLKVSKEHELRKGYKSFGELSDEFQKERNSICGCVTRNCACCLRMDVDKLHLHDIVCVNITYISEDIGVRLSFSVDDHVFYSEEISVRNPPPVCFDVPYLREFASICMRLENLEISKKSLSGCAELDGDLYHLRLFRVNLGCFVIPLAD